MTLAQQVVHAKQAVHWPAGGTLQVVAWTAAVTGAALLAGRAAPLLGPAVMAILIGMTLRTALPHRVGAQSTALLGHRTLQIAIVLLGASLNLVTVAGAASASLLVMLGTLTVGMFGIWQVGRMLGVAPRVRGLVAGGTSICGASAIAAIAPAIGAEAAEVSYAVGVIFLFNIAAVVIFPVLGHLFGFGPTTFGVWAGTAINDTSSVLAAGYAFGSGAAEYAATVKLARTIMILPVTVILAFMAQRWAEPAHATTSETTAAEGRPRTNALSIARKAVPWFVIGFVVGSIGFTAGLWNASVAHGAGHAAQYLTVVALAAIGLSMDGRAILRAGHRPVLTGFIGWALVATTSLALQGLMRLA